MRKILACSMLAAAVLVAPAEAKKKPDSPYSCIPKAHGFHAKGTLVSSNITQTAGADTAGRRDDRWSGDLVVTVKRSNHGAPAGEQTYTLDNAKVGFHPRNDTTIAAGDRVHVHGKINKAKKHCTPSETTITVKRVDVKGPKRAKPVS
jgi:hypothetical protein